MSKVNYALIGTVPEVEEYRDTLGALMVEFEANRPSAEEMFEYRSVVLDPAKLDAYFAKNENRMMAQAGRGVTIELCAQHFYGIDVNEVSSMRELIDVIRSMDETLEAK